MKKHIRKAVEILNISPEERLPSDIERLRLLTSKIKFFEQLSSRTGSNQVHIGCCKVMTVRTQEKYSYVFEFGERGEEFFIILSGTVGILVPDSSSPTEEPEITDEPAGFTKVAEISAGGSFGELALIYEKPRSATVLCIEDCVFAVLSKSDYVLVKSTYENWLAERTAILRSIDFFATWSKFSIEQFCLSIEEKSFYKGNYIYRENDPADSVYLILSGNVKFTKSFVVQKNIQVPFHHKRTASQYAKLSNYQVSIKGKKEIFGYEEKLKQQVLRQFSCQCLSNVKVFVISVNNFLSKLESPVDKAELEKKFNIRSKWTTRRMDSLNYIEKIKHEKSYTPVPVISKSATPEPTEKPFKILKATRQTLLPNIMKRMISHPKPQARYTSFRHRVSKSLFQTEVDHDYLSPIKALNLRDYSKPIKLKPTFSRNIKHFLKLH